MNEDPKLILGALRPNGADANDPAFAEALAAAERDPQLAAWFREAQEFDRAIADKLRGVEVPGELRAKILAGGHASRRTAWWLQRKVWALAALLMVLAGLSALWLTRASGLAAWQRQGIAVLDDVEASRLDLDHESSDPEKLVAWLQEKSAPVLPTLPDSLAARRSFGCKTWEWRGLRLALVCFDLGNSQTAHLVTTFHGGLKGAPPLGQMIYGQAGKWSTATWSEGGLACMLLTDAGDDVLKKLLVENGAPPRAILHAMIRNPVSP